MNYFSKLNEFHAETPIVAIVFNDKILQLSRNLDGLVPVEVPSLPTDMIGVLLTVEQARPYLDYEVSEYETFGYHPFVAWTENKLITVVGDLPRFLTLPRNPSGCFNVD